MNDMPQDAWFYTREGERIGPITFSDLQIKAKESGLNPRLDMVWTQGMAEWKPAGEIEGLFERRAAPEPQESLAPAADTYESPEHESIAEKMSGESGWPGARRRGLLFSIFIFPVAWNFLLTMIAAPIEKQFGGELTAIITLVAAFVPLVVLVYFAIQRFPNLGMSRWWFLAYLVPLLNIWTGYRSFACPAGYTYHKKLDGIGIFLGIIYWLGLVLVVLSIAAFLAVIFGSLGSPEVREQMQEAIRKISDEAAKR